MESQALLNFLLVLVVALSVAIIVVLMMYAKRVERHKGEISGLLEEHSLALQRQRTTQRSVHVGAAAETFAPWLPNFPVHHTEARHISGSSPVDFVGFRGLEGEGEVTIVFIEVKAGRSWRGKQLTPREQRVKDAVIQGRVEWCIYYPPRADDPESGGQAGQAGQAKTFKPAPKYSGLPPVPPHLLRKPPEEEK